MSATSLHRLDRAERRRLIARSVTRVFLSTVALFGLYGVLPAASRTSARVLAELSVGLIALVALLAWQIKRIIEADHPELRAAEALAFSAIALVTMFSFAYLSLSHASPRDFSQPLDHIGAMYFTVTVLSTVGFGDIVARTDVARMFVMVQILLDIGLVVGIFRTVVYAAREGLRRQQARTGGAPEDAA